MNRLKNNKGITGIDLTISIIVLTIFAGLIVGLMVNNYNVAIEIQKGANAMSYATMILEKVDEKAYEKVQKRPQVIRPPRGFEHVEHAHRHRGLLRFKGARAVFVIL